MSYPDFEQSVSERVRPTRLLPVARTLVDFAGEPGCADGLSVSELAPGTVVTVNTRHSHYRVVVLDAIEGRVLVTSGMWFPQATEVRLEGATAGGSVLKKGWIGVGLKLEMSVGRQRITTSRVVSVSLDRWRRS